MRKKDGLVITAELDSLSAAANSILLPQATDSSVASPTCIYMQTRCVRSK